MGLPRGTLLTKRKSYVIRCIMGNPGGTLLTERNSYVIKCIMGIPGCKQKKTRRLAKRVAHRVRSVQPDTWKTFPNTWLWNCFKVTVSSKTMFWVMFWTMFRTMTKKDSHISNHVSNHGSCQGSCRMAWGASYQSCEACL